MGFNFSVCQQNLQVTLISPFHEIGCIWDCVVYAENWEEMNPGSESGISTDALIGPKIFINEAVCSLYDWTLLTFRVY